MNIFTEGEIFLMAKAKKRRGRGEGGVRQRPEGTWEGRLSLGHDEQGKRRMRSVYGKTKGEVLDKLRNLQNDAASGVLVEPSSITVGEYMDAWLRDSAKLKCSPTTYTRYCSLVRHHIKPHLGNVKLVKLQPLHISHMVGAIGRAVGEGKDPAWRQKMALTVLSIALKQAVRLRLISFNPAADIPKARPPEKEIAFLTAEQAKKFLQVNRDRRLYALFAMALGTGMRQGELLGLKWECINRDASTVTVKHSLAQPNSWNFVLKEPKSRRSRRTIKLPGFVLEAMNEHREKMNAEGHGSPFCFVTKTGNNIGKSNLIRQVWRPALKAAGLPDMKFHSLRHSAGSLLLNDGASIKAVSQRLGHSSIEITLRVYYHCLPDADDSLALQADKLLG